MYLRVAWSTHSKLQASRGYIVSKRQTKQNQQQNGISGFFSLPELSSSQSLCGGENGHSRTRPWGTELLTSVSLLLSNLTCSVFTVMCQHLPPTTPVTPWPPVAKLAVPLRLLWFCVAQRVRPLQDAWLPSWPPAVHRSFSKDLARRVSSLLAQPFLVPFLLKGRFCVCRACGPLPGM